MAEVKRHPYLNCLCRSDGAVFVYGPPQNNAPHWTFGSRRGSYLSVCVENKNRSVHRLIAETFIENPEGKPCVDHINRNKDDNSVENLRWVTHAENQANRDCVDRGIARFGVRRKDDTRAWYKARYREIMADPVRAAHVRELHRINERKRRERKRRQADANCLMES